MYQPRFRYDEGESGLQVASRKTSRSPKIESMSSGSETPVISIRPPSEVVDSTLIEGSSNTVPEGLGDEPSQK